MSMCDNVVSKARHRKETEAALEKFDPAKIRKIKGPFMKKCMQCQTDKTLWAFRMESTGGRAEICKDCEALNKGIDIATESPGTLVKVDRPADKKKRKRRGPYKKNKVLIEGRKVKEIIAFDRDVAGDFYNVVVLCDDLSVWITEFKMCGAVDGSVESMEVFGFAEWREIEMPPIPTEAVNAGKK